MPERRHPYSNGRSFRVGGSQPAGAAHSVAGFSEPKHYDLHAGRDAEAARDAEVAETLAALRAKLMGANPPVMPSVPARAPVPGAPERCAKCGYLTTARGHVAECGATDA